MVKKVVIGITGCFGCGKSTVAGMFETLCDVDVIDADSVAKRIFITKARNEIKRIFKTTDTKTISKIVFDSKRRLKILNDLIHPYVREDIISKLEKSKKDTIMIVSPLLIEENKLIKYTDAVIIVKCKKSVQLSRLQNAGYQKKQVNKRIRHQLSFIAKKKQAKKNGIQTFIIDNSKSLKETERQVIGVCGDIERLSHNKF
jgi:dephospho-CoA kinase